MAFFLRGLGSPFSDRCAVGGRFDRTERVAASGCRGNACWQDRSYSDRQPAAAGRRRGVLRQMRRRRRRQPAAAPWRRAAPLRRKPVRSAAGMSEQLIEGIGSLSPGGGLQLPCGRCRPPLGCGLARVGIDLIRGRRAAAWGGGGPQLLIVVCALRRLRPEFVILDIEF